MNNTNQLAKTVENKGESLNIKSAVRRVLRRVLRFVPTPNWLAHYPHLSRLETIKKDALCDTLMKHTGSMVYGGPFSTMKLSADLDLSRDPSIIVGAYEEELHGVINEVICAAPTKIIDIGASFGYYAVGLALKVADTSVIAYEGVQHPHWKQLHDLASMNGVSDKISQRGFCTPEDLADACTPGAFVLCDCEGGEEDILDPVENPNLKSCVMLVELHESNRPNVVSTLISRFHDSHKIKLIEEADRNPSRYRILRKLPRTWRSVAVQENRWIRGKSVRTITWLRFMLLSPKASALGA